MEENTVAIDVIRVRFPADAYVIDIADAGEPKKKKKQEEIKLKHLQVQMTPAGLEPTIPGSAGRCLIHWATGPAGECQQGKLPAG